jgi:hypothetical protein
MMQIHVYIVHLTMMSATQIMMPKKGMISERNGSTRGVVPAVAYDTGMQIMRAAGGTV